MFGSVAALQARPSPRRRPNIIFLLTDDQRWDALGCTGNRIIQTPNIDRLARDGVVFTNNFCTTSICMTSRASIFTGLHEHSHGISSFQTPFSPDTLARTYPSLLRKAGYRTGFIGKYGVGNKLPADAFDYWQGFPGQGQYFHQRNGKTVHLTQIQQEQALEFLGGCSKDQPLCLSVSFKAPHVQDEDPRQFLYDPALEELYNDITIPVPKTAQPRYFNKLPKFLQESEGRRRWQLQFATPEMYQRSVKGYYRLLTGVDAVAGRLMKALEQQGYLDNTVLVLTGDNAYFLGEHGLSHKYYLYEESVRTPLVVWDPRLPARARGKRRKEMTLNIDLAPTFLSLAGVDAPQSVQGRDLTPLLQGRSLPWRKEWFYSLLFEHPRIPKSEGIRTERWTYIRWIDQNPVYEELFDLQRDPKNVQNLAGSRQREKQLKALRKRWEIWRESLKQWQPDGRWADPAA